MVKLYFQTSSSLALWPFEMVDHPLSLLASVSLWSHPSLTAPLPVKVVPSFCSFRVGILGSDLNPFHYPSVISLIPTATKITLRGITPISLTQMWPSSSHFLTACWASSLPCVSKATGSNRSQSPHFQNQLLLSPTLTPFNWATMFPVSQTEKLMSYVTFLLLTPNPI